jgi:hypothetical protein
MRQERLEAVAAADASEQNRFAAALLSGAASMGCGMLRGANYVILGLVPIPGETRVPLFFVRLVVFALTLFAIVDKNRP